MFKERFREALQASAEEFRGEMQAVHTEFDERFDRLRQRLAARHEPSPTSEEIRAIIAEHFLAPAREQLHSVLRGFDQAILSLDDKPPTDPEPPAPTPSPAPPMEPLTEMVERTKEPATTGRKDARRSNRPNLKGLVAEGMAIIWRTIQNIRPPTVRKNRA